MNKNTYIPSNVIGKLTINASVMVGLVFIPAVSYAIPTKKGITKAQAQTIKIIPGKKSATQTYGLQKSKVVKGIGKRSAVKFKPGMNGTSKRYDITPKKL